MVLDGSAADVAVAWWWFKEHEIKGFRSIGEKGEEMLPTTGTRSENDDNVWLRHKYDYIVEMVNLGVVVSVKDGEACEWSHLLLAMVLT